MVFSSSFQYIIRPSREIGYVVSRRGKGVQAAKSQDEMEVGWRKKPIARSIRQIGLCREQKQYCMQHFVEIIRLLVRLTIYWLACIALVLVSLQSTCMLPWHMWRYGDGLAKAETKEVFRSGVSPRDSCKLSLRESQAKSVIDGYLMLLNRYKSRDRCD